MSNTDIIRETKNYILYVEEFKDGNKYVVQNKDYAVAEFITAILPEAWQFHDQVQQFVNVNINTKPTIIEK